MQKLLVALVASVFAVGAYAQAPKSDTKAPAAAEKPAKTEKKSGGEKKAKAPKKEASKEKAKTETKK